MLQRFIRVGAFAALCTVSLSALAMNEGQLRPVGVARVDITPDYPIRLTGYAARKKESEGVTQHLWAKALAIGSDKEGPAILITVDNCGVPANVRDEVVHRLQQKKGINFDVNAYANDVPCYVVSERILKEGGYEGGGAMLFYDKPAPLAPGVENLIVGAVHELVPKEFAEVRSAAKR
jgi:hypothetical protein